MSTNVHGTTIYLNLYKTFIWIHDIKDLHIDLPLDLVEIRKKINCKHRISILGRTRSLFNQGRPWFHVCQEQSAWRNRGNLRLPRDCKHLQQQLLTIPDYCTFACLIGIHKRQTVHCLICVSSSTDLFLTLSKIDVSYWYTLFFI